MRYKPLALANTLIKKSGSGVEHMKLQKLTYVTYGWWLAFEDIPLLNEGPEVWKYGPVFNSEYHALRHFGREPIFVPQKDNPFGSPPEIAGDQKEVNDLVDWIWSRYGSYSALRLSDLTHQPDTPWYQVAKQHNFQVPRHTPIPDNIIRTHYRDLAAKYGFSNGN